METNIVKIDPVYSLLMDLEEAQMLLRIVTEFGKQVAVGPQHLQRGQHRLVLHPDAMPKEDRDQTLPLLAALDHQGAFVPLHPQNAVLS